MHDPIADAFAKLVRDYQPAVDAKRYAERCVARVMRAFLSLPWVDGVILSGSMARSTQVGSLHDADMIVVLNPSATAASRRAPTARGPDGDRPVSEDSPLAALNRIEAEVKRSLHKWGGTAGQEVWRTEVGNHVVRCDVSTGLRGGLRAGFKIEIAAARRHRGGHLLLAENDTNRWISTDPERLRGMLAQRQEQWPAFLPLVRLLKYWAELRVPELKGLAVEALALAHLHDVGDPLRSLAEFFRAAAGSIPAGVTDPTGHSGRIHRSPDGPAVRAMLAAARELDDAVAASAHDREAAAMHLLRTFDPNLPRIPMAEWLDLAFTAEMAVLLGILSGLVEDALCATCGGRAARGHVGRADRQEQRTTRDPGPTAPPWAADDVVDATAAPGWRDGAGGQATPPGGRGTDPPHGRPPDQHDPRDQQAAAPDGPPDGPPGGPPDASSPNGGRAAGDQPGGERRPDADRVTVGAGAATSGLDRLIEATKVAEGGEKPPSEPLLFGRC